ncbi:MAG: TRAP transporter small permease [Rhizobiales bacterium]|nr:TRAP transporter small permease [Hyphomicrobiales bacterium]
MSVAEDVPAPPAGQGRQAGHSLLSLPVRLIAWAAKASVVVALAVVLAFTVGQVADRYLLKTQFDTYDQFARIGLVWLTFLGMAIGVRERANIRIELLSHFLPAGAQRVLSLVLDLVILAVSVFLVVKGWQLLEIGAFQAIMGTALSYDVMYGALLAGMILLAFFVVLRLADALAGGRLGVDAPVTDHDDHH